MDSPPPKPPTLEELRECIYCASDRSAWSQSQSDPPVPTPFPAGVRVPAEVKMGWIRYQREKRNIPEPVYLCLKNRSHPVVWGNAAAVIVFVVSVIWAWGWLGRGSNYWIGAAGMVGLGMVDYCLCRYV